MSKKTNMLTTMLRTCIPALIFAFVIMIVAGLLLGYKAILVKGHSAEPDIHYQSLIITKKSPLKDLRRGDYVTTSISGKSLVTHQLIAVNYDGLWEFGDRIELLINGEEHFMYFGYKVDKDKTAENRDSTVKETDKTNIITMQKSDNIDANKDYRIYSKHFVGKVVFTNYLLGKTIFTVKDNKLILFGLLGMIVLLFVMREELSVEPKFQ